MLSILIPTHDYTCYKLVYDLHEQAERLGVPYEIILAEDGSKSQVNIIANHKITDLTNCRHIIRKENVGRAAIRNLLVKESRGDMLLFMDSDGKVINDDFLRIYYEAGKQHDVVCGGFKTPDVCYDPHRQLRWLYEREYERRHGYISKEFRSFCFLISRQAAERVQFDERYTTYGYEDVQFGMELQSAGYTITSISNPLENCDIEESKHFLHKTELALQNVCTFRQEIACNVRVAQAYHKCRSIAPLLRLCYSIFGGAMRANLIGTSPSLRVFSLYKLCYYAHLMANCPKQ